MSALIVQILVDAIVYFGVGFGLWVSLRILTYPDLSVEQLFVLGGVAFAICAPTQTGLVLLPVVLLTTSFTMGLICSWIRNSLRIHAVLVSLIASYAYYSLALVLMKAPNVYFGDRIRTPTTTKVAIVSTVVFTTLVTALAILAKRRWGLRIIASGSNHDLADRHRLKPTFWQGIGLGVAFSFVTLSGALFAWRVGYVDVGSGSGLLLIAIFVVLVTRATQRRIQISANSLLLLATLVAYLAFFQTAVALGMPPQWLRGLTAISLLLFLILLPRSRGKLISM